MLNNIAPKFSIVIPAYKRNDMVKEAISSVLNQQNISKSQLELIVSDDEKNKYIRNFNEKFFRKIFQPLIYSKNVYEEGPGGNRQTGFDLAKGKYIVFLDSDDRLRPNYLTEMESRLASNKYVAAVCFSRSVFNNGIGFGERIFLLLLTALRDALLLAGFLFNRKTVYPSSFYLCHVSHTMFKRDLIKGQKFNYDYRRGGEDWDFFVQTLRRRKITVVPKKLLIFRYSRGSSTDNPANRANKWKSYTLLRSRLTGKFRKWPYFQLLGGYIKMFRR